ncbi:MAG: hypothetical protein HZB39_20065 [Planctomycetes bacterium]|nr:hypothetical protein [Planctomycetota bacterium]
MSEPQGTRRDADRDWWPRAEHVAVIDPVREARRAAIGVGALLRASFTAIRAHGLVAAAIAAPFGVVAGFLVDADASVLLASTMVASSAAVSVVIGMRAGPLGATAPNWLRASIRALILSTIAAAVRLDVLVDGLDALLPHSASAVVALPLIAVVGAVGLAVGLHLAVAAPIALREDLAVGATLRRVLALTHGEHVDWTAHTFAVLVVLLLPVAVAVSILNLHDERIAITAGWVLAGGLLGPTAFALHERLLAHEGRVRQHVAGP